MPTKLACPNCRESLGSDHVCPKCGYHFRMGSLERLRTLFDGPWTEYDRGLMSTDPLQFTDTKPYAKRLKASIEATNGT